MQMIPANQESRIEKYTTDMHMQYQTWIYFPKKDYLGSWEET